MYCKADPTLNVALLRYFNPIGAHASPASSARTPTGSPTTWCPTSPRWPWASWKRCTCSATITPRPDGTGVRDYIHVVDLARGHVAAPSEQAGDFELRPVHLQPGHGQGLQRAGGHPSLRARPAARSCPTSSRPRRPGDIAECYADPAKARRRAGLGGRVRHRGDVRRQLELAEARTPTATRAEPRPPLDTRIGAKRRITQ